MNLSHRQLGQTGLSVPPIIFGTTCLGNLFVAMDEARKADLIRQWFRHVPTPVAIDSAGKYGAGLALEVLGRQLDALGVEPTDVIISNKLAWRRVPLQTPEPTFEPGVWIDIQHDAVQDIGYDGILRCHEDGCRMLGRYTPQLVTVHDPDEYLDAAADPDDRQARLEDIQQAFRALHELKQAGKVAGVGVGAKDWRTIQELDRLCELDWVMIANSLTIMHHPPELIDFVSDLGRRGVGVINSALTHGGFLVGGQFCDYQAIDPSDPQHAAKLQWRERYTAICRQHKADPFHVAVAFGAAHPAVTSVAL